jgi:DNA-binding GntR family transcriptional regulator
MQDHSQVQQFPVRDAAIWRLREAIVTGELEPGTRLLENELADRMQISRTPLREAFRQLEAEGLVQRVPAVGVFVAAVSREDADDVYLVKGALQVLAVDLACQRITDRELAELRFIVDEMKAAVDRADHAYYADLVDRFHALLLTAARSATLAGLYATLESRIRRYRRFVLAQPGREADSFQEHLGIASGLLNRDPATAIASMREHARSARSFIATRIVKASPGTAPQAVIRSPRRDVLPAAEDRAR